ncbi:MAG: hypothetical protein ACHQM6_02645 [Candidatus Kapaibacterium sp.]
MKQILAAFLTLAIFTTSGFAIKTPAPKKMNGYLIDKMCSKRMVGDHAKMVKHSKTCLTEESCAESGYGLMTEKKFIPFDAKGNELAAQYIKSSTKDKDFMVEVTGSMKKNKLAITDISDVKPQN